VTGVHRRVVVDHVALVVADLPAAAALYEAALAPLGFTVLERNESSVSFGADDLDDFGLNQATAGEAPTAHAHVAFVAETADQVDEFYAAALAAGATPRAEPAPRPEYSDRYYAAFVYDGAGNNVEAVFHAPAALPAR